jgi:hypothetical protein
VCLAALTPLRQGRKAWNATDLRDSVTGKWILDMSMTKPVVAKKRKTSSQQPTSWLDARNLFSGSDDDYDEFDVAAEE